MTARLATTDDNTMPSASEVGAIRDSATITRSARQQPQVGAIEFDSGYLSPYFVTHPERMEVAFENVYILIRQEKINSRKDLLPLLERIAKSGKPGSLSQTTLEATHWLRWSFTSCVACKWRP